MRIKNFLYALVAAVAVSFAACSSDSPNGIDDDDDNGSNTGGKISAKWLGGRWELDQHNIYIEETDPEIRAYIQRRLDAYWTSEMGSFNPDYYWFFKPGSSIFNNAPDYIEGMCYRSYDPNATGGGSGFDYITKNDSIFSSRYSSGLDPAYIVQKKGNKLYRFWDLTKTLNSQYPPIENPKKITVEMYWKKS